MPNACAICEMSFKNWQQYYSHHLNAKCVKQVKPVKLTSRTTKQIVADTESAAIKKFLIG